MPPGADVVHLIEAVDGHAAFVAADLDGSAVRSAQLAADAAAAFGRVTVLVNNAGIYPPDGTLATEEDTFDRVFAVNVKAPFFCCALRVLRRCPDPSRVRSCGRQARVRSPRSGMCRLGCENPVLDRSAA